MGRTMRSLLQPLSRYANVLTVTLGDNFIYNYMQCKIFTYISYIFYRYAGQSYLAYMYGPNGDEKNKVNYHTNAWGV